MYNTVMSDEIIRMIDKGRRIYFAYGRFMSFSEMHKMCPQAKYLGTTEIIGWYLTFQGNDCENIIPCTSSRVPVAVWAMTLGDEMELDTFYNYRFMYTKLAIQFEHNDVTYTGYTYVLNSILAVSAPSMKLKLLMQEGYSDNGLYASDWDSRFF